MVNPFIYITLPNEMLAYKIDQCPSKVSMRLTILPDVVFGQIREIHAKESTLNYVRKPPTGGHPPCSQPWLETGCPQLLVEVAGSREL